MTAEETIEKRLEKLAQAISPDDKLVENVMGRINANRLPFPLKSQHKIFGER